MTGEQEPMPGVRFVGGTYTRLTGWRRIGYEVRTWRSWPIRRRIRREWREWRATGR